MKIIPLKTRCEAPSPHVAYLDETPEAAAMATAIKFSIPVPETVYTLGRAVFVPVELTTEQFRKCLENGV